MTEERFNEIASATKDTGLKYKGISIYTNPYIEPGIIYFINEDNMEIRPVPKIKTSIIDKIRDTLLRLLNL